MKMNCVEMLCHAQYYFASIIVLLPMMICGDFKFQIWELLHNLLPHVPQATGVAGFDDVGKLVHRINQQKRQIAAQLLAAE